MDDSVLVEKCIKGDQRAQRVLFEKYARKMLGVCLRYSKSIPQAEDVLQEGFIKVFSKLEMYKGGSLEGWIRKIMVNSSLDKIRKEKKRQGDVSVEDVGFKLENNSFILENLEAEELLKLIATMPLGYKTVFNMFAIEGFTHKEIAQEMNISENTSKSQYSRARAYLQNKMKEVGIER